MPVRHRHATVQQPLATINLTPMLDICFTLLIAFMIVAPTLRTGLNIDLPKVTDAESLPQDRRSFTLSIRKPVNPNEQPKLNLHGETGETPEIRNMDQLRDELGALHAKYGSGMDLLIEADRLVPWETMAQVINMTRLVGIKNAGVMTDSEKSDTEPKKP